MNTQNAFLDNKYIFTSENLNSIPAEIKTRINTLHQINTDLNYKRNVTESFYQFSSKKKAELKKKLKEADDELQSLEKQIETYYNCLFSDMQLDKKKSMNSNLILIRELLDNKNAALKIRKEILAEREVELNKRLLTLDKSKLDLFNQMMAKIDKDGSDDHCLLSDTNTIKMDYEKLKNKKINQLAKEMNDSFNIRTTKNSHGNKRPKSVEVIQMPNDNNGNGNNNKNTKNNRREKPVVRNSSITHQDCNVVNRKMVSSQKMKSLQSSNKIMGKFHSKMFTNQ